MREHAADVASTGNHGQSIAYAAGLHGLRAVVFVPEGANPDKIASMRRLGAEVREQGARFAEANAAALEFAAEHAMRYVAVDEPLLLPGVATAALEVLDPDEGQQPDTELVIVPLGGGSGACGWVLTREGLGSACEVWAVQSAQAPAGHDSWREGRIVERPDATMAEGMATGTGFEVTQAILRDRLDDFLLVEDRGDRGGRRRVAGAGAPARRAGGSGAAGGRARGARSAARPPRRAGAERRQHHARAAAHAAR